MDHAPFAVIENDVIEIVSPEVHTTPPAKFRSEPDTPTVPCATTVVPAELVAMRQYPAVPEFPVAVDVIVFIVSTPEDTVPIVDDIGRDTSSVPEAVVEQCAGTDPV